LSLVVLVTVVLPPVLVLGLGLLAATVLRAAAVSGCPARAAVALPPAVSASSRSHQQQSQRTMSMSSTGQRAARSGHRPPCCGERAVAQFQSLERLVATAREQAAQQLHAELAALPDEQQRGQLAGLLTVGEVTRTSRLERLRRGPTGVTAAVSCSAPRPTAALSPSSTGSFGHLLIVFASRRLRRPVLARQG
jgi:hypothetical protein